MCGRFALFADENEIVSHFRLSVGFSMRPRFNIAPTQIIPAVTRLNGPIDFFRWGFIPPWEKGGPEKLPPGYINARLETISEKPAFKKAFASQRCLIPASGYFEWRTIGQKKQPYFVYLKEQPLLGLAGIWTIWQDNTGQAHPTCAILTQESPECLKSLHERSPIVIQAENYHEWLWPKALTHEQIVKSFLNMDAQAVGLHAVTPRMSRSDFEGPECILRL